MDLGARRHIPVQHADPAAADTGQFDIRQIEKGLYTEREVKILNNMALCYSQADKHVEALDILRQLLGYLQTSWKKILPHRAHIPLVAYNYARELSQVKRYAEAIDIAEEAKNICINYGHYQFFPDLLAVLAECCFFAGDSARSAALYRQAYYLYEIIENEMDRSIIRAEARERLGLILE